MLSQPLEDYPEYPTDRFSPDLVEHWVDIEWDFRCLLCDRKTPDKAGKPQGDSASVRKRDADDDGPDEMLLGKRQKLETVSAEEIK